MIAGPKWRYSNIKYKSYEVGGSQVFGVRDFKIFKLFFMRLF